MFTQPLDFRDESESLYQLVASCDESVFARPTQFKCWTVEDVLVHLHMWNQVADWALHQPERFSTFMDEVRLAQRQGEHHQRVAYRWLGELRGKRLLDQWHRYYSEMAVRFSVADPRQRVKWAGPDMTVEMSITARQMETWSHGQAIFDLLGKERQEADRIQNIVLLGVMTFGWTFDNRGIDRPTVKPYVNVSGPSGAVWHWNPPSQSDRIDGEAIDFARVVTQVRNVADTELVVTGDAANRWMSMAQCFAGPVEEPPAPGTRFAIS